MLSGRDGRLTSPYRLVVSVERRTTNRLLRAVNGLNVRSLVVPLHGFQKFVSLPHRFFTMGTPSADYSEVPFAGCWGRWRRIGTEQGRELHSVTLSYFQKTLGSAGLPVTSVISSNPPTVASRTRFTRKANGHKFCESRRYLADTSQNYKEFVVFFSLLQKFSRCGLRLLMFFVCLFVLHSFHLLRFGLQCACAFFNGIV